MRVVIVLALIGAAAVVVLALAAWRWYVRRAYRGVGE